MKWPACESEPTPPPSQINIQPRDMLWPVWGGRGSPGPMLRAAFEVLTTSADYTWKDHIGVLVTRLLHYAFTVRQSSDHMPHASSLTIVCEDVCMGTAGCLHSLFIINLWISTHSSCRLLQALAYFRLWTHIACLISTQIFTIVYMYVLLCRCSSCGFVTNYLIC